MHELLQTMIELPRVTNN